MDSSALYGVINKLRAGEQIDDAAIEEIARVLQLLEDEGWSGLLPADVALESIVRASREQGHG